MRIDFNITLESENILLRPLKPEDFGDFLKITVDKNRWKYFTSDLSDGDELRTLIGQAVHDRNSHARIAFTIIDKLTGSTVGSSSIGNISERDQRAEIGWTWLGRAFQGKGINDRVKYMLLNYCFEELDCMRVEFKTDILNLPARNALKRIGAIEEGVLRSHTLMTGNRRRDTIYYSLLRHEWNSILKGVSLHEI